MFILSTQIFEPNCIKLIRTVIFAYTSEDFLLEPYRCYLINTVLSYLVKDFIGNLVWLLQNFDKTPFSSKIKKVHDIKKIFQLLKFVLITKSFLKHKILVF